MCVYRAGDSPKTLGLWLGLSCGLLIEEDLLRPSGVVTEAIVKGIHGELIRLRREGEVCEVWDEVVACDFPDVCIDGDGVVVSESKECDAVGDFPSTAIDFGEGVDEVGIAKCCKCLGGDVICMEKACSGDDPWCPEAKAIGT